MSSGYVYPGSRSEFYAEYGGLPGRGISITNILLIVVTAIIIIIIVVGIALLLTRTRTAFDDHTGFYNLDTLRDVNNAGTECCVFAGAGAPNEQYIYIAADNITYARQKPTSINTVCNSFPDPQACVSENTDSEGNIIPIVTFKAKPYFTFEYGLFVQCASTTTCT